MLIKYTQQIQCLDPLLFHWSTDTPRNMDATLTQLKNSDPTCKLVHVVVITRVERENKTLGKEK